MSDDTADRKAELVKKAHLLKSLGSPPDETESAKSYAKMWFFIGYNADHPNTFEEFWNAWGGKKKRPIWEPECPNCGTELKMIWSDEPPSEVGNYYCVGCQRTYISTFDGSLKELKPDGDTDES